MARVSTYLNFPGTTEEAFEHYRSLFGTDYLGPISRYGDMGGPDDSLSPEDAKKVAHAELEIVAGHVLMGTDMLDSMGQQTRVGNNTTIHLELDSRDEVDRLFRGLDEGGTERSAPEVMPWGQYWGVTLDRFGIRWMLSAR